MGLDDLFHFDQAAYAVKVSGMPNQELKQREIEKIRQFLSGSCTAGLGLGTAAATGGISLGFTALAGRNMQVANSKLDIIQAELRRRGIPTHDKLTSNDKMVPVMGGVVGMMVGGAAEGAFASDGGVGAGAAQQAINAVGPSAGDIIAANVVGARAGASMRWALETVLDPKDVRFQEFGKSLSCSRLAGTGLRRNRIWCDVCGAKIERGIYARNCRSDPVFLFLIVGTDGAQIAVNAMTASTSVSYVTKRTRNVLHQRVISCCFAN